MNGKRWWKMFSLPRGHEKRWRKCFSDPVFRIKIDWKCFPLSHLPSFSSPSPHVERKGNSLIAVWRVFSGGFEVFPQSASVFTVRTRGVFCCFDGFPDVAGRYVRMLVMTSVPSKPMLRFVCGVFSYRWSLALQSGVPNVFRNPVANQLKRKYLRSHSSLSSLLLCRKLPFTRILVARCTESCRSLVNQISGFDDWLGDLHVGSVLGKVINWFCRTETHLKE
jgi:hypothetical protein